MENLDLYEFNVQIWCQDEQVYFSVIQEFETDTDSEVEPLFMGTADSWDEAAQAVSVFMSELKF